MNKLKKLLRYGNADPDVFEHIFDNITENNLRSLKVYSLVAGIGMLIMVLCSLFVDSLGKFRGIYLFCVAVFAALYIISRVVTKKHRLTIYACVDVFLCMLLAFGIAAGTIIEPNETSVSFPVLLFAVPFLFTDRPYRTMITMLIGIICYCIAAILTQDTVMLGYNLSNVIPYGFIGIGLGIFMMTMKIHSYVLEYENKVLAESDMLTGMLNRYSYERDMDQIRKSGDPSGIILCLMDVNGLKKVNDTLGHSAGDEMIRGAAECIRETFAAYGKCYRIGGDEFVAVVKIPETELSRLQEALNRRCESFRGSYGTGLTIALGAVVGTRGGSIDAMMVTADEEMYAAKSAHYARTGYDRRK